MNLYNFLYLLDITSTKKRIGFNDKIVGNLGRAQIFVGLASMLLGLMLEICGVFMYYDVHWAYLSLLGSGMWCGLMFIAVGYLGVVAVRRKSTCFIVALMAFGMATTIFACLQMTISICAIVSNIDIVIGRFHSQIRFVHIVGFVLNLSLTLLGFFVLGLLIATVVYSSIATCCQPQPNYLRINVYERVSTPSSFYSRPIQTPDQMQPQPCFNSGGSVYYAPEGYGGKSQGETQPLVLMPNHQFIPVQYQTGGAPYQNHSFPSSPQQAGSEPSRTTDVRQDAAKVSVQQM